MKALEKHFRLSGRVQVAVREGDKVVKTYPWQKNLILDHGMDRIAAVRFNQLFSSCAAGSGTTPVIFMPPAGTQATISGNTLTATAPVFDSSMLLANVNFFYTIHQYKIVALVGTAPTATVTLAQSSTVIGQPETFRVDFVNQSILANELKRTSIYLTSPDACISSISPGDVTMQRTFLFPAESINTTYTEIGLSDQPTPGANLFSRIVLDTPITVAGPSAELPSGQQLQVVYQLVVNFDYGQGAGDFFPGFTPSTIQVTNLPNKYTVIAYAQSATFPGNLAVSVAGQIPSIVGLQTTLTGCSILAYNGVWTVLDSSFFTDPTHGPSTILSLQLAYTATPGGIGGDYLSTSLRGGYFRACQGIFLVGEAGQSIPPTPTADEFIGYGEPSIVGHAWVSTAGPSALGTNNAPVPIDPGLGYDIDCIPNAYTSLNFYLDQVANIPIPNSLNASSFGYGLPDSTNQIETFFWNQPQALAANSSLSLTFRLSWARAKG